MVLSESFGVTRHIELAAADMAPSPIHSLFCNQSWELPQRQVQVTSVPGSQRAAFRERLPSWQTSFFLWDPPVPGPELGLLPLVIPASDPEVCVSPGVSGLARGRKYDAEKHDGVRAGGLKGSRRFL